MSAPRKTELLSQVLAGLKREFETLTRAAFEARGEATHSESKQESKYDTRGIEASYLADGQSKRAAEVQSAIEVLKTLPLSDAAEKVRAGSIVTVEREGAQALYFVLPFVGGMSVADQGVSVKVVSSSSPLGKELLGRVEGEEFTFNGKAHEVVGLS